jgi:chromosome segregation ATPase
MTAMTQANEPSGQDYLNRTVRALDRRVARLEDTQITDRELGAGFDRVRTEIDSLKIEVRELRTEIGGVKADIEELSSKFDVNMHYITGNGSSGSWP